MKSLTPAQSLVFLVLAGVAISGWAYGIHWKRIASGDLFSTEERLMIRLQDQIRSLTETNANLNEQLRASVGGKELTEGTVPLPEKSAAAPVPTENPAENPVENPSENAPLLPNRPQKIETH